VESDLPHACTDASRQHASTFKAWVNAVTIARVDVPVAGTAIAAAPAKPACHWSDPNRLESP
jgi:hypothetical protein